MASIIKLDKSLVNKIAAGEVVERPLSVVKELCENSIDSGASVVTVEIADGGISLIRVTDNGSGIPATELPLAFARHATSKIASFNDLMQVKTLGFRGEALSSIAAVAQVELITKTIEAASGTKFEIHGGEVISTTEAGATDGTTLVVRNLFYNVPARRKFLKKPATEAGYVSHLLERLALANPALSFRYINNGQNVFRTTGSGGLKTVLLNIYGKDAAKKTIEVDAAEGGFRLSGLAGKPELARGNRRHGSFFVNGRYVDSRLLTRAVETAMQTMLPKGKFPLFVLNLEMPSDELDVNVHPTKMDARFEDEEGVFAFVERAVRLTLEDAVLVPASRPVGRRGGLLPEPEQLPIKYRPPVSKTHRGYAPETSGMFEVREDSAFSYGDTAAELPNTFPLPHVAEPSGNSPARSVPLFEDYKIYGLLFSTYWLVSQGDSLFVIDQHAAHERVLYENILQKAQSETVTSQALLAPIPLTLTPREAALLMDNTHLFSRFGFGIKGGTGAKPPVLTSVPFLIKGPEAVDFFAELLDKLEEAGFSKDSPYSHKTELIAMAACKAAIKAGDMLDEPQAEALIKKLLNSNAPFTCPHGRPTIIEITKSELERRFMRT